MADRMADMPEWLAIWRAAAFSPARGLRTFDVLPTVEAQDMLGLWRGVGLATGHPFDGLLEAFGWWGKAFRGRDEVDPLLFTTPGGPMAVDPAWLPVGVAVRIGRYRPELLRGRAARWLFAKALPHMRAERPAARLRDVAFRGQTGAAMIYDRQPIVDHFRRIDDDTRLGLMDLRGQDDPFFFLLTRERLGEDEP